MVEEETRRQPRKQKIHKTCTSCMALQGNKCEFGIEVRKGHIGSRDCYVPLQPCPRPITQKMYNKEIRRNAKS